MNSLLRAMKMGAIITLAFAAILGALVLCIYLMWVLHDHIVPTFVSEVVFNCGMAALLLFVFVTLQWWTVGDLAKE